MTVSEPYEACGLFVLRDALVRSAQDRFAAIARAVVEVAPLLRPTMRDGTRMRLQITSAGDVGWWSDSRGYRYVDRHPVKGVTWPAIDPYVRDATLWVLRSVEQKICRATGHPFDAAGAGAAIDTCLINLYERGDSLGWHIDRTEEDRYLPIVTFSIGAAAVFEIELGGLVYELTLNSGDAIVMAGEARLARHRVARIVDPDPLFTLAQPSPIKAGTRLSFTLRRARKMRAAQ